MVFSFQWTKSPWGLSQKNWMLGARTWNLISGSTALVVAVGQHSGHWSFSRALIGGIKIIFHWNVTKNIKFQRAFALPAETYQIWKGLGPPFRRPSLWGNDRGTSVNQPVLMEIRYPFLRVSVETNYSNPLLDILLVLITKSSFTKTRLTDYESWVGRVAQTRFNEWKQLQMTWDFVQYELWHTCLFGWTSNKLRSYTESWQPCGRQLQT